MIKPACAAVTGRPVAVAVLLVAAACQAREEPAVYRLAEIARVAPPVIGTNIVIPAREDWRGLHSGWDTSEAAEELANGIWAFGRSARVDFESTALADTVLRVEARIPQPDRGRVQVRVNGRAVGRLSLRGRWLTRELTIPAARLQRGTNELTFAFEGWDSPSHPGDERRRLGARFRLLELTTVGDRPSWPDRPVEATWAVSGERLPEERVVVPTDSAAEIVIEVPEAGRLAGRWRVLDTRGTAARGVRAEIALAAGPDDWSIVHAESLDATDGWRDLDVDLAPWAGRLARLRLAVDGPINALMEWDAVRVTGVPESVSGTALVGGDTVGVRDGVAGRPAALPFGSRPDIIVILLDAARADVFSPYGARRPTPAVDALAAEGTVFERAYAPASWTGPSVASLLTGRYPAGHGVQTWEGRVPEPTATLPEMLREAGYRTLVWSQHTVYAGNPSLLRAVERHVEAERSGAAMTPAAADLFVGTEPVFALLHVLPPHGPYTPPAPFAGRYTDWWTTQPPPISAQFLIDFPRSRSPEDLEPDHLRFIRDAYADNVAFADSQVGDVIETLRAAGRYDGALVILLSDHGEAFLEHGHFLHTNEVYDEFIRIPLVIKWPRAEQRLRPRVEELASLVDVLPTLAAAAGVSVDPARIEGRSLIPAAQGVTGSARPLVAHTLGVTRYQGRPRPRVALITQSFKLIERPLEDDVLLYDLTADSGEVTDLARRERLRAAYLRQQLRLQLWRSNRLLLADAPEPSYGQLDPDVVERLRALGYVQ